MLMLDLARLWMDFKTFIMELTVSLLEKTQKENIQDLNTQSLLVFKRVLKSYQSQLVNELQNMPLNLLDKMDESK